MQEWVFNFNVYILCRESCGFYIVEGGDEYFRMMRKIIFLWC